MEASAVDAAVMASIAEKLGREKFMQLVDETVADIFVKCW